MTLLIIAGVLVSLANIALMVYIFRRDFQEKEPILLILLLMLIGGLEYIFAAYLNGVAKRFWGSIYEPESILYRVCFYTLGVGVIEEGLKLTALMKVSWNNRNFNWTFDSIVYSAAVATGFSLVEDYSYVYALNSGEVIDKLKTALSRSIYAFCTHFFFALIMGYFVGKAKEAFCNRKSVRAYLLFILGFILPVIVHGAWDVLATSENRIVWAVGAEGISLAALFIIKKIASTEDHRLGLMRYR